LTNEQGLDAYNRRFTYFVRQQETSRTADTVSAMRGNMTIHSGMPGGLGLKSAGNPGENQIIVTKPVTIRHAEQPERPERDSGFVRR